MTAGPNVTSRESQQQGVLQRWNRIPLYFRILLAMAVGVGTGMLLGERAIMFYMPSQIILRLLGALAPPLILVAVAHVMLTTDIPRAKAIRLAGLLVLNTAVAVTIGLGVANIMKPGSWMSFDAPQQGEMEGAGEQISPLDLLVENIPKSLMGPLGDQQNIIGVILIAVAFGVAMRNVKGKPINNVTDLVEIAYETLLTVLHWIIHLVPLGVFCIVAKVIGTEGFAPFRAMGAFMLAVMVALALQSIWYLVRIQFFSWARPFKVLVGIRDALVMAFSTGSSTATMPVTYACLKEKVKLREQSASLGALVGANFNNDGTALYEAMAALFVAQLLGQDLSIWQQLIVVATSIIASVGAAGIPEAGLVTMTLVFTAVGLPIEYIGLLLTVDWFLDRCRTTINVLGDVNVSCILDGRQPPADFASSKAS